MSNKFYDPGENRAAKVNDLFARIAPRYDLINDLQSFGLHRLWKRRLIRLANVHPGDSALDLCCGTGDLAFSLAQRGAKVVGLDFSGPMLEVAQSRKDKQTALSPSIDFFRGDAMRLPFTDAQFDVVTISYGLRNLAQWQTGLNEMARVAKPGGRVLVLDFGKPENSLWRAMYFAHLRWFVPLFGRIFCKDSETHGYILESLQHYPAQKGVAAHLQELKLRNIQVINLLGGAMSIHYAEKG